MNFTRIIFFSLLLTSCAITLTGARAIPNHAEEAGVGNLSGRKGADASGDRIVIDNLQCIFPPLKVKPHGIELLKESAQDGLSAGVSHGIGIVVAKLIENGAYYFFECVWPSQNAQELKILKKQRNINTQIILAQEIAKLIKECGPNSTQKEALEKNYEQLTLQIILNALDLAGDKQALAKKEIIQPTLLQIPAPDNN